MVAVYNHWVGIMGQAMPPIDAQIIDYYNQNVRDTAVSSLDPMNLTVTCDSPQSHGKCDVKVIIPDGASDNFSGCVGVEEGGQHDNGTLLRLR